MHTKFKYLAMTALFFSSSSAIYAMNLKKAYDMPDATEIIQKDLFPSAKKYTMPKSCDLDDPKAIARGKYMFNNLNGKKVKNPAPEGLVKFIEKKNENGKMKKKVKQFGNCVACHNIEDARGAGNIGPSLESYKTNFIDTKIRDAQFVYQKIADPRIDNPRTHMTVNLTTGLFNEKEICDFTAYVISDKNKK